jgi:acyl-CoA synthetase (AMP-forming)/AMP-acid ligase II
MNIFTILDMAASDRPDATALGNRSGGMSFAEFARAARGGATIVRDRRARSLVYIGLNGEAFAVALFAAAAAGVPVVPLNYRLGDEQLSGLLQELPAPLVIADDLRVDRLDGAARTTIPSTDWVSAATAVDAPGEAEPVAPDAPAVILFTSGTTSKPKGVVLTHEHLASYVLQTVEFSSAAPDEAGLTCLPNYHIAGVANLLTSTYAGRRVVYLGDFRAADWLRTVREERVTSATVVPTMLARIVEELGGAPASVPTLRSLAYGGAPMPPAVIATALRAFPDTGFVNAYGLTETSSTIAVLGPDDHRAAVAADDGAPDRLRSVGRPIPGIEAQIRTAYDGPAEAGELGRLWVRGPQISGHYLGSGSALDAEGWFDTRDEGWFDGDGYLYIRGRADDTIIRGSENIAPAEIEFVLDSFPGVRDVAVVGVPDDEWGERIVAVVVLEDAAAADAVAIQDHVRDRLRSSRTPDEVVFRAALPYGPTGKLLRNALRQDVCGERVPL